MVIEPPRAIHFTTEGPIASFFVDGLAQTKGSWRSVGKGRLIPDNPAETAWASLVGWSAKLAMGPRADRPTYAKPETGPVAVSLVFVLPAAIGRKNKRDVDKLARSVLDALTGIVYVDDEQVWRLEADKVTADRGHGVRVHVSRLALNEEQRK